MQINLPGESEESLDFTKRAVPPSGRMNRFGLTMAWWACCSAMFYLVVAATLASIYGTVQTMVGLILSVATYAAINAVICKYAIRTGTSVSLFSRLLFGRSGSVVASSIFAATAIYYAVFEGSVIAVAAKFLVPSLSYEAAAFVIVLYSVPLVFGSVQHWLDKFNGVLLPVYLIGLAASVVLAIYHYGYSPDWLLAEGSAPSAYGWWNVYVAYMGAWILMMSTFDFSRFGKLEDANYHAYFNFGVPFYTVALVVNGMVGIFLVNAIPIEGPITEVSAVKGIIVMMGLFGLLFVWVTQTRINTANYYLASVNLESVARLLFGFNPPKVIAAIVVGIIVYVLMLWDVFSYLMAALSYQSVFLTAWVGAAVAYIVGPAKTDPIDAGAQPDSAYPAYNLRGLSAWFLAVAIGIAVMHVEVIASLSAPITVVSSFLMFFFIGRRKRGVEGSCPDASRTVPRSASTNPEPEAAP